MGQETGRQTQLFYEFNLDERVPSDHIFYPSSVVFDLSWLPSERS